MIDGKTLLSPSSALAAGAASYGRPRSVEVGQQPTKLLGANRDRLGAWIANNGGMLEIEIELPQAASGIGLAQAAFLDSAGVQVPQSGLGSYKTFMFHVDTTLTWVTAGQATMALLVGRRPWGPLSGAGSQVGDMSRIAGATVAIGSAGAVQIGPGFSGGTGSPVRSPAGIPELQWPYPYVGAEFVFPSALTAGAARLFLEMSGGPTLYLGGDLEITNQLGGRGGAWPVFAQSAPFWVATQEELYGVAGPGGLLDCRIWEVLKADRRGDEPS